MKLYIPYIPSLVQLLSSLKNINIVYYEGVNYPEVSGGRVPVKVKDKLLDKAQIIELAERHGPDFSFLASSLAPEFSHRMNQLCEIANKNSSSIVVADYNFAQAIKGKFPDLHLNASCAIFFHNELEFILKSNLFDYCCMPHFWNYDINEMVSKISVEYRKKAYFIINTRCKWESETCLNHYTDITNLFKTNDCQNLPRPDNCHRIKGFDCKSNFKKLNKHGFDVFKLQGRGVKEENPKEAVFKTLRAMGHRIRE